MAGRRPGVRERVLAAAVELFAGQGYDATSVQQVVERAQVTKGALYHYFSSKDDLLYEIYHHLISLQLAELDAIVARQMPTADAVGAVIASLVSTTAAHAQEAAVFGREMHRLDKERREAIRADRRRYHETFRAVIDRGQARGELASVASAETVTLMVFGMVNQIPVWYRPDGPKDADQLTHEVTDFVLAALRPA
ncbi:TetR/AcrR family transcriptional regulator [Catellatospora tritici]|uniref:TetR/AcrR family transcriptional regulator n=1 Tax=Catellatospora tritici TaxID=2851566 RepID=UPI001C2D1C2D|nr:TetR/AcrR family transcriptional regulator [Catellatospora tritici]MBV1850191.1 TetR/AcrR family transcriptional regulator [Catellatospora tritici]